MQEQILTDNRRKTEKMSQEEVPTTEENKHKQHREKLGKMKKIALYCGLQFLIRNLI